MVKSGVKRRRDEYAESTRAALLEAAATAFARRGFAATSVDEIAAAARVTKGALYHHFKDKTALFEAVFAHLEQALAARVISATAQIEDPWQRTEAGLAAFFEASLEPVTRRIAFQEAPVALGWARWRELDERYMMGILRASLQALHDQGAIRVERLDLTARVLFGALIEASLAVADAKDVPAARRAAKRLVLDFLRGLSRERDRGPLGR